MTLNGRLEDKIEINNCKVWLNSVDEKVVSFAKFPSRAVIYKTGLVDGMSMVSRAIGGIFQVLSIESSTALKLLQRVFPFHDFSKRIRSGNDKNYLKMRLQSSQ